MTIAKDLSGLPRRSDEGGLPPSRHPFVVEALAHAWEQWYEGEGLKSRDLAIPEAGPYRGSMASSRCNRQLYYALRQSMNPAPVPDGPMGGHDPEFQEALDRWERDFGDSNPSQLSDYWTFWLGQVVHSAIQPIIMDMFPGAAEVKIDLRPVGIPGSAHSDLQVVIEADGHPVLVEIKSTNGFSFKMQACKFQGPPQGPRYGAVMQTLLSAKAQGIDRVVVVLVALERVGPSLVEWTTDSEAGRFLAEWHFTVSEMEDQITAEVERIAGVMADVEADRPSERKLVDPEYPAGAIVARPLKSKAPWQLTIEDAVVDSGTYWGCGYCRFLDRCQEDGP